MIVDYKKIMLYIYYWEHGLLKNIIIVPKNLYFKLKLSYKSKFEKTFLTYPF